MIHIIMMHAIVQEHMDNISIEVINRINIISREICQKKKTSKTSISHMRNQSHLLVKRASSVVPTFKKKKNCQLANCKLTNIRVISYDLLKYTI